MFTDSVRRFLNEFDWELVMEHWKVAICDLVYEILLKWDREKRKISHGQDTIDYGYTGLSFGRIKKILEPVRNLRINQTDNFRVER